MSDEGIEEAKEYFSDFFKFKEGDFFESRDGFLGTILSWGKCDLS